MIIFVLLIMGASGRTAFAEVTYEPDRASAEESQLEILDLNDATLTLGKQTGIYNGLVHNPGVTVKYAGKTLAEGIDYVIRMPVMKEAGTYYVSVSGIGRYKGALTEEFTIRPIDISKAEIYLSRDLSTEDLSKNHSSISDSVLVSTVSVIVDGRNVVSWCNINSEVDGTQVTIKVEPAFADGKNVLSGTISKTFNMKVSLNDCYSEYVDPVIYSGNQQTPKVNVRNSLTGEPLKQITDYVVAYNNNINTGFAEIIVTGRGNYVGEFIRYFVIEPKNIFYCTAFYSNGRNNSAYTGDAIVPAVTLRSDYQTVLMKDYDYKLLYRTEDGTSINEMKEAGKYKVVVSGIGNYNGEILLDYEVNGIDISNHTVSLKQTKVKADGTVKVPQIDSVKLGNTSTLLPKDYDVVYIDSNGKVLSEIYRPGKYQVQIHGKNSYSGTASATFEIVGTEQSILLEKTEYKKYPGSSNFQLTPTATGDGTGFIYVSSDPEVATVNKNGVVNVHELGRAKITITTVDTTLSSPVSKSVIIKVYPYKTVLPQKLWTDAKKSFRVRWNTQENVTYYQVRYSTTKDFKEGTYWTKKVTQNTKGYKTQSTKVSNLKSGKRFYVKVRAVKTVKNDAGKTLYYYGNWSNWKSIVTK